MKFTIFTLLIAACITSNAQPSNLTFFTDGGELFTLFVNGKKYNESPQAHVTAKEIETDFARIKIVFNGNAEELNKSMMIDIGNDISVAIRKNKKGKYVLNQTSSLPTTDDYSTSQPVMYETEQEVSAPQETTETSKQSETNFKIDALGQKINIGISIDEESDEIEDPGSSNSMSSSQNTTPSGQQLTARVDGNRIILSDGRTFSFKYVKMNNFGARLEILNPVGSRATISYDGVQAFSSEVPFLYDEKDWKKGNDYFKLAVQEPSANWSVKLKYSNGNKIIIDGANSNPIGGACGSPMSSAEFSRAKASIESKSYSEEQITVFKQIIRGNCVSVAQVIAVMNMVAYEDDKLQIAMLAYKRTSDQNNYYQVNDALTYSDSVDQLNRYLQKH